MGALHEIAVSTGSFIVLVFALVVFHELGHLIAAKACKVRVNTFSVGFGPRLLGFHRGETEYKVCLLPIGGYIKISGRDAGESGTNPMPDSASSGKAYPRWQRMIIAGAGPAANFLFAFILMAVYYAVFNEKPKLNLRPAAVDWVIPDSDAARAGFQTGDVIQRFDSLANPDWIAIDRRTQANLDQTLNVAVIRDERSIGLTLHISKPANPHDFSVEDVGLLPRLTSDPIGIGYVESGLPAAAAGIRTGDQIVTADGLHFHFIDTLVAYMQTTKGKPINIGLLRDETMFYRVVKPLPEGKSWSIGVQFDSLPVEKQPLPTGKAISQSVAYCTAGSRLLVETVMRLFIQQASVTQLAGPIDIARIAGTAAEAKDWISKFDTAAIISLNLAVFNLLPLPILDGGQIVMLLFESIRQKDISITIKERINKFAYTAIAVLFVIALFNDMSKLSIFTYGH